MDRAHRSHRWDHWLEFSINPEIQNLLLPKDRKVVALRQRNRRGNLQNWEKADNNGNSKATQIVAFLSENILSGAVKTGQLFVFIMIAPCRCFSFILQKAPIVYIVIKVREGPCPSRHHTVIAPSPAIPERHKKSEDILGTKTKESPCQTSARCGRVAGGRNTSRLGFTRGTALQKCFNPFHSMDFYVAISYNNFAGKYLVLEERPMNEIANITKWEDRFTEDKQEVANMDRDDFINLLVESRIIQAS